MKPHNRDEFKFSLVVTAVLLTFEIVFLVALVGSFQYGWLYAPIAACVLVPCMMAVGYFLRMAAYSVVALWRE